MPETSDRDPPAGTAAATLRGVADSDVYVDSRMRVTERLQVTRQPITGDRLTACTATAPPLKPAPLREDQLGFRALQQRCASMSSSVLRDRLTELTGAGLLETDDARRYRLTPLYDVLSA